MFPVSAPNRAAFRAWLLATSVPLVLATLHTTVYPETGGELIRIAVWTLPFGVFIGLVMRAAAWPSLAQATRPAQAGIVVMGAVAGLVFAWVAQMRTGAWAGPFQIPVVALWGVGGLAGATYAVLLGQFADAEAPPAREPLSPIWRLFRWLAPAAMLLALKSALMGIRPYDYGG